MAKRRLAHVLDGAQRAALVLDLFRHVASVLTTAGLRVVALSPGHLGAVDDIETWKDEAPGLNAALRSALQRIEGPVLIVPADLPDLTVPDVGQLLASPAEVVVARARDGGTNALFMRGRVDPAFGTRSALVHAARARAAGLRTEVLDIPGFAWDVDDEASLTSCRGASYRRRLP